MSYGGRDDYGGGGGGYDQGGYGGGERSQYQGGPPQGNTGTSYGGGGAYGGMQQDFGGAMEHAQQHAGQSGDSSIFSSALSMLSGQQHQMGQGGVDEQHAVQSHQAMYGEGGGGQNASSGTMGSAAAMQALKMFTGGQGGGGGHGGGQNQFIGMAMAQASKLFDQQAANGNVQQGASKQEAVNHAAQMAMKMFMHSEMGGGGGGGGLMSLASKFLS